MSNGNERDKCASLTPFRHIRGEFESENLPAPRWPLFDVIGPLMRALIEEEIRVTPPTSNPGAFNSLQKGQKVSIKGVLRKYDAGGLFVPKSFFLEDAEIVR